MKSTRGICHRHWARVTLSVLVVVAVGAPAAIASYQHMQKVGESVHEPMAAWLPLSVDGMLLAALVVIWERRLQGRPVGAPPWVAFWFGMTATVAANLASVTVPSPKGYIVALFPPLALAITLELVAVLLSPSAKSQGSGNTRAKRSAPKMPSQTAVIQSEKAAPLTLAVTRPADLKSPVKVGKPSNDEIAATVRTWPTDRITRVNIQKEFQVGTARATVVLNAVNAETVVAS